MVSAALSLLPPTACCERGPLLTSSSSSGWAPLLTSSRVLGRRRSGCAGAIRFTRTADLQSPVMEVEVEVEVEMELERKRTWKRD